MPTTFSCFWSCDKTFISKRIDRIWGTLIAAVSISFTV